MPLRIVMFSLLLAFGSAAHGACTYNGQTYPEGSRIGPYTCVGGQWVIR